MRSQKNVSLKSYNTFGLDVKAATFYEVCSITQLQEALYETEAKKQEFIIFGGGSNMLLTRDISGAVIKNSINGIEIVSENASDLKVKFGAGENWHSSVLYTLRHNWGGLENLSLIPGTMGAAPMQNIGAYGVEICDVFEELTALNIQSKKLETFSKSDCNFGYRESVFKNIRKGEYIIVDVTLGLTKHNHSINSSYGAIEEVLDQKGIVSPGIQDISQAVIEIRQSKLPDPQEIGNAGSFFKNPSIDKIDFEGLKAEFTSIPGYQLANNQVKVPAAWLIEQCGWKGIQRGKIGVHKKQALVLVNYGGGNGKDLKKLAFDIQESVIEKFK
ncbi:MAG: UDP-N-acetylmuramate dehydrogenase, partial [Bacteroidota bacterium]